MTIDLDKWVVDEDKITKCYEDWYKNGCLSGCELENKLRREREIKQTAERKHDADNNCQSFIKPSKT